MLKVCESNKKNSRKLAAKLVASVALLVGLGSLTVQAAPAGRTVFTDSFKPLTEDVNVLGAAQPNAKVSFQIALKMRDSASLDARIAAGEIIPTAEMAAKYFPTGADYQALLQWVRSQNLSILATYPNHLTVEVGGTVKQVAQALQVPLAQVQVQSENFIATQAAPSLPDYLTRFVLGVNGLQPYQRLHPLHTKIQPLSPTSPFVPPYSVNDLLTAYSARNLGVNGTGQRTAILIDTFPLNSDLTSFWTNNGIAQTLSRIERIQAVSGTLPPTSGEETLDVEWSSGIAPSSIVRIYASQSLAFSNIDTTFQRIISDLNAGVTIQQLSISLGACERLLSSTQLTTDNNFLATIASRGVSVFVSSGDSGSNGGCGTTPGVDFYASSPNVTAVGGTTLRLTSTGSISSETGWSGSGGGSSTFFARPSYQTTAIIPASETRRRVPDVALVADPNTGAYVFLNGRVSQIGGTSLSAPIWAGFSALINQARANAGRGTLGLLNPRVYPLIGTTNFRDITSGSNGGFNAVAGYDRVTGLGVPVVSNLLNSLRNTP
ncbi:S53 family peptidase [Anthocerotibacter panamensis]|uniref:S53 family peptidase n=1 Tax=Anthocerotibacter panamensis TaxID=2857077 RepID=UPI001C401BC4|nr:S53 family peptidase [Anthocerotibacter panamensis]